MQPKTKTTAAKAKKEPKQAANKLSAADVKALDQAWKARIAPSADPHVLRTYRFAQGVVHVYKTMTFLVQGPDHRSLTNELARLLGRTAPKAVESETSPKKSLPSAVSRVQLGADEVGVGDYFGPVVVAAVLVRPEQINALVQAGVKDSKLLADSEIKRIAQKISGLCPCFVQVAWPEEYNAMTEAGLTAHHVKTFLHNKALAKALEGNAALKPLVILDQFASKKHYERYSKDLKQEPAPIDVFATQAEGKYIAVAAASIVARAAFLQAMGRLNDRFSTELPLGATNVVAKAQAFYKKFGKDGLRQAAKLHFKTTAQVIA